MRNVSTTFEAQSSTLESQRDNTRRKFVAVSLWPCGEKEVYGSVLTSSLPETRQVSEILGRTHSLFGPGLCDFVFIVAVTPLQQLTEQIGRALARFDSDVRKGLHQKIFFGDF
jgi:hypothetical protein